MVAVPEHGGGSDDQPASRSGRAVAEAAQRIAIGAILARFARPARRIPPEVLDKWQGPPVATEIAVGLMPSGHRRGDRSGPIATETRRSGEPVLEDEEPEVRV